MQILRLAFAVLIFAVISLSPSFIFSQQTADSQEIRGVEVTFELDDKMFPRSWVKPPVSIKATPIDDKEKARSLKIAKTALEKYPKELLKKNIKNIYFVKTLNFSGIGAGGTYFKDRVYLANNGKRLGYTDTYLEGSFHHEFSSILINNHKKNFDSKAWKAANVDGFEYGDSGTQAVKEGKDSLLFESKLAKRGFINEYGQSNLEEDFNTIASRLLMADKPFWRAYKRHDRLQKKINVAIRFYSTIDATLDKQYFEELGDREKR